MERESFDELYETYFDPVYRYMLSLCRDSHTAEEITQEAFFKAMRSLGQFRGECSIKSWLCTIARNLWLSDVRKNKRKPPEERAEEEAFEGPEEALLHREESMHIHRVLHCLEEPYREVFTLRTLGQLSFRDIGDLFGKSENWACVVYHRARTRIKERMEK